MGDSNLLMIKNIENPKCIIVGAIETIRDPNPILDKVIYSLGYKYPVATDNNISKPISPPENINPVSEIEIANRK